MSQFSKRQHLIDSIKKTVNKPPPLAMKPQSPKLLATKPSYSSYLNTAIDYTKDHSITPYLNDQQVYDVDSNTQQSSSSQQQDLIVDQQYDDQIMNEIEMEIYSQQMKRISEQNGINDKQDQQEEYEMMEMERIDYYNGDNGNNAMSKRIVTTNGVKNSNITFPTQIKTRKITNDINYHHQEETKIADQDDDYEQPIINIPKKNLTIETVYSQPVKKIHLHTSFTMPKKYLKFSINCQPLNANLDIKRVIKCVSDGSTKKRQDASYLVQLNNHKKQQKIVSNNEMIYFYKDALIDYYQALHFS